MFGSAPESDAPSDKRTMHNQGSPILQLPDCDCTCPPTGARRVLPPLTVAPLPRSASHVTACAGILQYLTSVSGGINEQGRRESTMSERAVRHVGQSRLTFREVFTAAGAFPSFVASLIGVRWRLQALIQCLALAL